MGNPFNGRGVGSVIETRMTYPNFTIYKTACYELTDQEAEKIFRENPMVMWIEFPDGTMRKRDEVS